MYHFVLELVRGNRLGCSIDPIYKVVTIAIARGKLDMLGWLVIGPGIKPTPIWDDPGYQGRG